MAMDLSLVPRAQHPMGERWSGTVYFQLMFTTEIRTIIMFLMNSTCVLSIRNIIDMFTTERKNYTFY